MKELLLFLSCVLGVSADVLHEEINIGGCSDSDGENMYGLDGEEIAYADFNKQEEIYPQPPFIDPMTYPGAYDTAVAQLQICRTNLKTRRDAMKDIPLEHGSAALKAAF